MPLGRQAKVKAMKIYTVSNNKKEEGVQANASTNKRKPIRNTFISLLFAPPVPHRRKQIVFRLKGG